MVTERGCLMVPSKSGRMHCYRCASWTMRPECPAIVGIPVVGESDK